MARLRVGVIYGGPSNEHDVSVASGKAILEHLDKKKYEICKIFIDKGGLWLNGGKPAMTAYEALENLKQTIDVALLGVHGTFGEDGHLQSLLDAAKIKYTGSGSAASKLAFDKAEAQKKYASQGLLVPKWQAISSPDDKINVEIPFVVKPVAEGSSVGVSVVKQMSDLTAALNSAFKQAQRVMIQEFIDGVEVSCGVIENPRPQALTPTELRPVNDTFFSYKAKYQVGGSDELTPPELPEDVIESIKTLAIKAHTVLGCRGYSRTDMFVQGEKIYMIETNTLPGFTPTSILPQEAQHDGISYAKLLDIIIGQAKYD